MKQKMKKSLALLLTLAMCLSLLPVGAMAEEGVSTQTVAEETLPMENVVEDSLVEANAAADHVVINQVYGGGGNAGAPYTNDFIELYNSTSTSVSLAGWSVQYASAAGASWQVTELSGSIAAGGYYLIQEGGGSVGEPLPTADAIGKIAMGASNFKVALSNTTTAFTTAAPTGAVDFVGAGTAGNYEGTGAAPAPSNTTSTVRKVDGVDTNDNSADFEAKAPNPRNSTPIAPPTQVVTPTADPAAGGVIAGAKVALKCGTSTPAGTEIWYTTDGSTPVKDGAGSTKYEAPITIIEAVTINAIGVDTTGDLLDSVVLTAVYTMLDKIDISAVRAAGKAKPAAVEGVVIAEYKNDTMSSLGCYIQDSTGGIMLFDKANLGDYSVGDTLKVTGTTDEYSGKFELTKVAVTKTATGATVTPAEMTIADFTTPAKAEAKEGTLVTLTGLTVDSKTTDSFGTCVLVLSGGAKTMTAKLDNRRPNFTKGQLEGKVGPGDTVTVVGYIESDGNNTKHLLHLRGVADVTVTAEAAKVSAPLPAEASGAEVKLNAKVPVSCATPGAVIQYNTTSATAEEGEWLALPSDGLPMPGVRGNYTFYLRATKESKTPSDVVTVIYSVGLVALGSIWEARAEKVGEEVHIQGIIVGYDGYDLFIQDATAGVAVEAKLDSVNGMKVGDEVAVRATVQGPDSYSKLLELKPIENGITIVNASAPAPTPIPVTPAMINSGLYEGRLVKLSRVILHKNVETGLKNHSLAASNGVECAFRAKLDVPVDGAVVDVVGVVSSFSGAAQLIQQTNTVADTGVTVTTADGSTIGDAIPEAIVWSAPSMTDSDPIPAKWPAVDGVNKAGAELAVGGGAALAKNSGKGYSSNKWDDGAGKKYWQIKFSTEGLCDVTVSSDHFSSNTGPSAFRVQYSLDGTNFYNVAGGELPIIYTKEVNNGQTYENSTAKLTKLPLPADANDKATVYVRWLLTSNEQSADHSKPVGSGGTNQINSIIVAGNEYYSSDDVAPVKSTPAAGAVGLGATVTLRTATAGTTIRYTTDNSDPNAATGIEGTSVTLTTLPMNVKAVAYKTADPAKISPVKTFVFTQGQAKQPNCNKMDGSKIVVGLDMVTFTCQKGATVKYKLNDGVEMTYDPTSPIALTNEDFVGGKVKVEAWTILENYLPSEHVVINLVKGGDAAPKNYFGQLHSHTAENSDGAGTLEEAFDYAANKSGVDFLAVTDHSNGFDTADKNDGPETYNLTTYNADNEKWVKGHTMADKYTDSTFVGMYGYEMTWSGGPGHINTFATNGFVSRNNTILNSKTGDKGMRAYYELLSRPESSASISQFNHPGTTFGNFANYGYYDPTIDSRISLVEVGNGEGAIGSGGYFPSYSEYTLALDKGWHLAPTNNQDNHKGKWGDANTARSVVYTNDFTREGIYQAMRDMRVYASEDKNLDIVYTVNGVVMGTILNEVPATANFKVVISDADSTDKISKVEIITVGGSVAHKVEDINQQTYTLEHTMAAPVAGYYYIRVTEADKDIAVTAPIWLGAAPAIGMSELTTDTYMAVKGEALDLNASFFNNEEEPAVLKSVKYTIKGSDVVLKDEPNLNVSIEPTATLVKTFAYTPTAIGKQTVVITAVMSVDGKDKTLTSELTLDVKDPDTLIYVGVDGSHYNEYVTGNYTDSMGNFGKLAGDYSVRVNVLKTSEALMSALSNPKYKMFVFTAPTRRLNPIPGGVYASYSDAELTAISNFAKAGGSVVVTGWGDYYESYDYSPKEADMQMAAQQNKLLKAIGSTLRLADDEAKDNDNNPGSNAARLYLNDYNGFKNPLLAGVNPQQVFSQYGGSTVFAVDSEGKAAATLPSSVIPMISGYGSINSDGTGKVLDKINSYDDDKDGYGAEMADKTTRPPKYASDKGSTVLLTASETVDQGNGKSSLVVVSGGAFMSNFEIKFDLDNATQLNYSNSNILGNLVETLNPPTITTIADVTTKGVKGETFTIEGTVMTTTWNGTDSNTGFFDCVYVQDATGGINVFPVSSGVEPGQKVRVTGVYDAYEGERQLQSATVKVMSYIPAPLPAPREVTTKDVVDQTYMGQLIKVTGTVVKDSIVKTGDVVDSFLLLDESGTACRIFIDGYITKGKTISGLTEGATLAVVGISSFNKDEARVRVFDRANVYDPTYVPPTTGGGTPTVKPGDIKVSDTSVEVKLPSANAKLNAAASEKVVTANATKPVKLSGPGLKVTIPVGTLSKGADVNTMVVNPKDKGNVIQVTRPDGTKVILPFAAVGGGSAAYLANVEGTYKIIDNTKTFPDAKDHWAAKAIDFAAAHEFFKGTGDGSFSPEMPMTRGMLVTVLARIDGGKTAEGSAFVDVPATAWYAKEVAWAAQNKLVEGNGTSFDPDGTLTREQLCVILARYLKYSGLTLGETKPVGEYSDMSAVSPWAADAMELAIKTGLIDGKSGGLLDPQGQASRAEIATILQRFVEGVLK